MLKEIYEKHAKKEFMGRPFSRSDHLFNILAATHLIKGTFTREKKFAGIDVWCCLLQWKNVTYQAHAFMQWQIFGFHGFK